MCIRDRYNIFADFVWSAQYAVLFDTYKAQALTKGQQPTDGGFLIQFGEFIVDFFLLFFDVFEQCYIANLFMLIGKFTATPSGSTSFLTTIGFEFYEFYT